MKYQQAFPRGTPFWDRMTKPESGCWEWQAARAEKGYGIHGPSKNEKYRAHRYAYELTYGPIPEGTCVLHRCDNPPCCRPDHLFLGTKADNAHDMVRKGRHKSTRAKLTAEQVQKIRRRAANGEQKVALAKEFGVCRETIRSVINGRFYQYIPNESEL